MAPETQQAPPQAGQFRPLALSLATLAAVGSVVVRLVPHLPNVTPVGSLSLYGGGRLPLWQALLFPLAAMAASDLVLEQTLGPQYHPDRWVYASLVVSVLLGRLLCRKNSAWRIGLASVLGSVQFFLVTNFGTWWGGTTYPHTLGGLLECYVAGLAFLSPQTPLGFFGNTLMSDLGFTAMLFGAHALLSRLAFPRERAGVPAVAR
jgi:hypothetical protein